MKYIVPVAATLMLAAMPAHAGERVGDAALGALSGAVVFGPVGLVAGAIVGYTAGPSIAQSWRNSRHHPRHAVRAQKRPQRVAARQRAPSAERPAAGSVTPAPARGTGGPPAQGFE
jgi:hypothetical protein